MTALDRIHHDGSAAYVDALPARPYGHVAARVRVPRGLAVSAVTLRVVIDGEPRLLPAAVRSEHGPDDFWEATLPVEAPLQRYRWLLQGGSVGHRWLNAAGLFDHDVSDAHDFTIFTHAQAPDWMHNAVVYQVFPDRFAASGREYDLPEWALPRAWSDHPEGHGRQASHEYFGGDLWGIVDHLSHLEGLGVNVLYLTPFFPAASTHRYDAASFDVVDPLLGGDEALAALCAAAHARGMRVIGDLTTNHSGMHHPWFEAARSGDPEYRDYYTFDDSTAHGYVSWFGVRSLPKFNFASESLRQRLVSGEDSVLRKWLRAPYHLDGWRIDVANMTARQGGFDANHEVAALARAAVEAEGTDKALIAEHFHDAGPDVPGDGWHGAMNYACFSRPVWAWLRDPDYVPAIASPHTTIPSYTGSQMVASMRELSSRMPWASLLASWNVMCSHDTARIRTMVGSRERQVAALVLAVTLPGVPMIFAGDELGARGRWGEDSRTPFPWHERAQWDEGLLAVHQALFRLRRASSALARGGMRWALVEDDAVVFLREESDERLLIAVTRAASTIRIPSSDWGITRLERLFGFEAGLVDGQVEIPAPGAGAGIWRIA